jgi:hypothetical protein
MSHAAGAFAAAVVAVVMLTVPVVTPARAQIHSEFPALTRPFTSETYSRQPDDLRARLADRGFSVEAAVLRLSRGGRRGGADAAVSRGDAGGSLALQYRHGRYALSGEAIGDGRRGSEPSEYPVRVAASGVWPEARVFAALVAGCDADGYAGTDLALEGAPLVLRPPASGFFPADFRPRLIPGARLRMPARGGGASLAPAAVLVLDHLPALASSLVLASSVQSECCSCRWRIRPDRGRSEAMRASSAGARGHPRAGRRGSSSTRATRGRSISVRLPASCSAWARISMSS